MKEGIHPKYYDVEARCACGATWKTRSTKPELHLEICSNCHPFFTGKQKLIDTEGRVERFTKKFGAQTSESRKNAAKAKKATEDSGHSGAVQLPLDSSVRSSPAGARRRRVHAGSGVDVSRLSHANSLAAARSRTRCSWWIASASIASRATCARARRASRAERRQQRAASSNRRARR